MGSGPFPARNEAFQTWLTNFVPALTAEATALNVDPAVITQITAFPTQFATDLAAVVTKRELLRSAVQTRDARRREFQTFLSDLVKTLQVNPAMTDAIRARLGITIPDRNPTPVPAPSARPLATVDIPAPLAHKLRLVDEADPTRRAKPAYAAFAEIAAAVTPTGAPAPADEGAFEAKATISRTTATLTWPAADAGKTAWYKARYANAKGQPGPWGPVVSAPIAA